MDIQGDEPLVSPEDIDNVIDFHNKNNKFDVVVPCIETKKTNSRTLLKLSNTKIGNLYDKIRCSLWLSKKKQNIINIYQLSLSNQRL